MTGRTRWLLRSNLVLALAIAMLLVAFAITLTWHMPSLARFMPNIKVSVFCGGVPLRPHLASLTHPPHVVEDTTLSFSHGPRVWTSSRVPD